MQDVDLNSQGPKTIFDLPFEDIVVTHIAKYLKISDLVNLRMCSRDFKNLSEMILEEKRELRINGHTTPKKEILDTCQAINYCKRLRIITILHVCLLNGRLLEQIVSNKPQVTKFVMRGYGDLIEKELNPLTECYNLTSLELQDVTCRDFFLKALAESKISLLHVNFTTVHRITGRALADFFASQHNLRSITMDRLRVNITRSLLAIGENCAKLEKLSIGYNKGVTDEIILKIANRCPHLHTFEYNTLTHRYLKVTFKISKNTLRYLSSKNIIIRDSYKKCTIEV